jgi:hypothetical protein
VARVPNIGEPNPDVLFLSIGRALSQWEMLELNLAILHTIFVGQPRLIDALQQYGTDNGTVRARLNAVKAAGERFFLIHCDQGSEGEFSSIIKALAAASTERHRIAHGIVTPVALVDPDDADSEGWITIGSRYNYFLGAPWYSTKSLKMSFAEMDASMIDDRRSLFYDLAKRVKNLGDLLSPEP